MYVLDVGIGFILVVMGIVMGITTKYEKTALVMVTGGPHGYSSWRNLGNVPYLKMIRRAATKSPLYFSNNCIALSILFNVSFLPNS